MVSNVIDTTPATDRRRRAVCREILRPLKVGFIGLCLTTAEITPERLQHLRRLRPDGGGRNLSPHLVNAKASSVIVAITHLSFADDRALALRYPQIDLLSGPRALPITATENRTLISKAVGREFVGPHRRQTVQPGGRPSASSS